MKKKRPHFKNTGTGEYDIESLSSYGGLEVEEEVDGSEGEDEEEEDEKMLEHLEEKQLMGRIEGLEGSKYAMTTLSQVFLLLRLYLTAR